MTEKGKTEIADPAAANGDADFLEGVARDIKQKSRGIKSLLPPRKITRADESLSHYISDADFVRFRHAGSHAGVSAVALAFLGAVVGAGPSYLIIVGHWVKGDFLPLPWTDAIPIIWGTVCILVAIILWMVKPKGNETVDQICDEIMARQRSDAEED